MKVFGIYETDVILNIIVSESKSIAEDVTKMNAIEILDSTIGIGSTFYNNKWRPVKTFPSWVWNDSSESWEPPIPEPFDPNAGPVKKHYWNEEIQNWSEIV